LLLLFADDYLHIRPLGVGGMGQVFRAEERRSGHLVALKVPDEELLKDERLRNRFMKEMQALAGVSHPNVVPLVRVHLGERPFYTMEVVGGEDLAHLVERKGKLAVAEAAPLLQGVASAISFLHGLGIVHQDLKPENVLIDIGGRARLSDFGMAVEVGREFREQDHFRGGSPAYMAPEQLAASAPRPGVDVYAFGVLAFKCLTGELPFPQEKPLLKLTQVAPTLKDRDPTLPSDLSELVKLCLVRSPSGRPKNGTVLLRMMKALKLSPLAPPA
jgi:serine/threonine-protein kinase